MTLNQLRQATIGSLGDTLEDAEALSMLAAIDRQIVAGQDPNIDLGLVANLDRLPRKTRPISSQGIAGRKRRR